MKLNTSTSRLNSVYDTHPREYLLSTIFKEIQQGNATLADLAEDTPYRTLAEVTERARELRYKRGNIEAYELLKKGMPQFIPAAILTTRSDVKSFSCLVCLEWDGDIDTAHALVIGKQHPNVLAIWRSLSGNPKFLVPISPISKDGDELTTKNFKHAWYSVSCLFEEIGDADTSAMSATQPQALCYDPDLHVKWEASPVEWDIDEYAFEEAFPNLITPENLSYADLPVEYHIAIQEMDWRYDGDDKTRVVGKTRVPCPWGEHDNDGWESSSNATRILKNGENDFTFQCFKCPKPNSIKRYSKTYPIEQSKPMTVAELVEKAPPPILIHTRSFAHWTTEERIVVKEILGLDADAGWNEGIPAFATQYENLEKITGQFALNGQPEAVEKQRVWYTQFSRCERCGGLTAAWIDRYRLTAGRYCNSCHTDTPIGSYLEWELKRKLPNSIVSDYQGFLGDDPEFRDFRLWQPQMFSHLGAGMATGKSTEIYKAIVALVLQKLGVGIIAVPRISLASFLAHQLRKRHGRHAWGLWHEGSGPSEQFIGEYGAIVCLPSLGRAVTEAYKHGLMASDLYVAIDEVDFGYSLLSLAVHQAAAVKKALLDIFLATGLVVSGQTESTLALEAFASELGCENVQGFYNTAPRADGIVELQKYPDVEGKNAIVLAGSIEAIEVALRDGHNAYVFCASRRDGDVIAERFAEYAPVVYNSYTKGDPRCDAVLKNQHLPEGIRLFIGTSAAGVGISILDPKARTIRVGGLTYGSRDASMGVQTTLRDRGRRGIEWHYADYNFALPMRPRETERVSLYHEKVKQLEYDYAHLSDDAVKKVARSLALSTLADHQLEAFVKYHLGEVGNMQVVESQALLPEDAEVIWVTEKRRESIRNERETKCTLAINILKSRDLYTSREIRLMRNRCDFTQDEQIAHKYANGLACAVGWDDENAERLEDLDMKIAVQLAEQNMQPERLEKLRRGYLAVHYPQWVINAFEKELEETHTELLTTGKGRELPTVPDDRFLGVVLKTLLDRLKDEVFESDANLATAIREVLDTVSEGQMLFGRIKAGGLGTQAYRRARFLKIAGDTYVINWARMFIREFYPATLSKRGNHYALVNDKRLPLILESIRCWLSQRVDGELPRLARLFDDVDPQAELKTQVRERRQSGASLETIKTEFGLALGTVSEWCKDIKVLSPIETEVIELLEDGQVWKTSDILKHFQFAKSGVMKALKTLVEKEFITKIKQGHYQQSLEKVHDISENI